MPIYTNNQKARELYMHGSKIKAAWVDDVQVFQAKKRQLTGFEVYTGTISANMWLRGMLEEYGESYSTVQEIPFKIDSSKATYFNYMFSGCANLRSVPDLDTSNGTSFVGMFSGCANLRSVPDLDTSNGTSFSEMFFVCASLKDGNVRLIRKDGTLPLVRRAMITSSGLTREPFYDRNGRPI